jgi:hypothetical protein
MATCAYCGETIVFGGVKAGQLRFCNATCQGKARMAAAAAPVPEEAVANLARQIHSGPCPRCQGPGPVDVHIAYWVWSALVFTRWGNKQQVSCRRCAVKTQAGCLAQSAAFGWWGFPFGILITPVQVCRTAVQIVFPPNPAGPSAKLHEIARSYLTSHPRPSAAGAGGAKPIPDQWDADEGAKPIPDQWEADD